MRKKKIRDNDWEMPIGELTEVENFLPPPEELVFPDDTVKITLNLTVKSIGFFKREAKKHHTKYQKMIRCLLEKYAAKFS